MSTDALNDPELDSLLFDAIEQQVMNCDVSVTFKRCWVNAYRPDAWQVTYHLEAARQHGIPDGKAIAMATGGGTTLREAVQRAFALLTEERLAR